MFTLVFRALGTDRLLDGWITALPGGEGVATPVVLAAFERQLAASPRSAAPGQERSSNRYQG